MSSCVSASISSNVLVTPAASLAPDPPALRRERPAPCVARLTWPARYPTVAQSQRRGGRTTKEQRGTRVDARRFDALTRSLAAAKTRRGFLGTLATVGAGFFGARTADAQVTRAQ